MCASRIGSVCPRNKKSCCLGISVFRERSSRLFCGTRRNHPQHRRHILLGAIKQLRVYNYTCVALFVVLWSFFSGLFLPHQAEALELRILYTAESRGKLFPCPS